MVAHIASQIDIKETGPDAVDPTCCSANPRGLNNEKSYVYDRDTGVLTKPDINLETLVRQRAEEEILKAALEDGILEQAQLNAEAYLLKFFAALGYPNTIFVGDQG